MTSRLFTLLLLGLLMSCQPQEGKQEEVKEENVTDSGDFFEVVPNSKIKEIYETADKVDVLFNDIAVSLSQTEQQDIRGQVGFMKPGKVPKDLNCSETASIIYQSNGEIIGDGRMYLRGNCRFVVFYEGNEPQYAAHMTDQGMEFYRRVLASGQPTIKQ